MTINTGKDSEKEFESRLKRKYGKECFIYRVTDSKEVRGRSKSKTAFTKAQPSDYIITIQGAMFYAEVKSCSSKTSFPFSQISEVQLGSAKRQRMAGGLYFFYVHNKNTDNWYIVPSTEILDHDKKSFKWTEMEKYKWH